MLRECPPLPRTLWVRSINKVADCEMPQPCRNLTLGFQSPMSSFQPKFAGRNLRCCLKNLDMSASYPNSLSCVAICIESPPEEDAWPGRPAWDLDLSSSSSRSRRSPTACWAATAAFARSQSHRDCGLHSTHWPCHKHVQTPIRPQIMINACLRSTHWPS